MACCVVAALVLAVLHGLTPWRRRAPDIAGFAPTASRPGPGEPEAHRAAIAQTRQPAPLSRRLAALGWVTRFVAVGAVFYVATVALLVRYGIAHTHASQTHWLVRTLAIVGAAAAAMALSTIIFRRGSDRSSGRQIVGFAAIGLALMAIEGMAFDMHLMSMFHLMNSGWHDIIHFAAFGALVLGFAIALPESGATKPRQPSSKAG